MKFITQDQIKTMFGDNSAELALSRIHQSIKKSVNFIKIPLNLGNKFSGWMFGIQRNFIQDMNEFPTKFGEYQRSIIDDLQKLKTNLNLKID